jgi:hypothetical protein
MATVMPGFSLGKWGNSLASKVANTTVVWVQGMGNKLRVWLLKRNSMGRTPLILGKWAYVQKPWGKM